MRPVLAASALSLGLLLPAPARAAGDAKGFASALPAHTLAFVGVDDVAELVASLRETAWGRFLRDQQLESFRAFVSGKLGELSREALAETGVDPLELLALVDGRAALALVELAEAEEGDAEAEVLPFTLALLLEVGERRDEFLAGVERLFEQPVESGDAIRQHEEVAGVDLTVLRDQEGERERFAIRFGMRDGVFLLTVQAEAERDADRITALVDGLDGRLEETLAEVDAFARSAAGSNDDGIRCYADGRGLMRRVLAVARRNGSMDENAAKGIELLGLEDLGALAVGLRLADGRARIDAELDWGGQGRFPGILRQALKSGPLTLGALMPERPLSASLLRFDALALLDGVMAAIKEIAPEEGAGAEAMLEQTFQQDGWNVRHDLLANLAGEIGYYLARVEDDREAMPGSGEDDPQSLAILLALKDGSRVETVVDQFLREQGFHAARKRREFQGQAVYSFPFPLGGNLHYAIAADLLVVSFSAEMLNDVLRRRGSAELPNLAANEEFQETLRRLKSGDVASIGYTDAAEQVSQLLRNLKIMAEEGHFQGVPVRILAGDGDGPPFTIPDPELAAEYFKGASVTVFAIDGARIRLSSIGP